MKGITSTNKGLKEDIGKEVLRTANRLLFYPQPGPQTDLLAFKAVPEVLFGGARGGGKTAALLGDFVSDVPVYKSHWIGVLFRRTYPELEEVIRQSFEFYPQTGATYNANEKMWKWGNGAKLYLRYIAHPRDATNYQGHAFSWLGWDELGNWATDEGYQKLIATLRSRHNVPLKRIRATANPGGIGHGWVKDRFQIGEHPEGYKIIETESGLNRMFIPSKVKDNLILLKNDPSYVERLKEVGSAEMVRAWLHGDWDVVAGAYFPEFSPEHVTDSIDVVDIPNHWKIYRAYDHGTYHPFCVLWYTFAGEDWKGIKKGTIVILREWYGGNDKGEGFKMSLVDVRDGIAQREATFNRKVEPGPADNQIFENHGGQSIADAFAVAGIYFARSDKARIPGWNQVRVRLKESSVLIARNCKHLIRTLPMLQHDESKPEDVDTRGDDHASDVLRYICMVWPVIPKFHRNAIKGKNGNVATWAELVEATDDITTKWRL